MKVLLEKMCRAVVGATGLLMLAACQSAKPDMCLDIDLNSRGAKVPSSMYGIFFEEINHAGDGGLYGEMLMNRSFEERVMPQGYRVENGDLIPPAVINHLAGKPTVGRFRWGTDPHPGWEIVRKDGADAVTALVADRPNFQSAPTSMKIDVRHKGEGVSLVNKGYWGIALKKEAVYKLRMFVRSVDGAGELKVRLLGTAEKPLGECAFSLVPDGQWHEYKAGLTASDTTTTGRLAIDLPSDGTYYFDYVSLFPEDTYKHRENGMRKDVAEMLEGLKPAFIRWPGGCIVEGITLNNRVEWKKTLGDPASRPGQYDTWGYHNTYGFGYKEFLDFCEDIGAKGMYVCNVGIACQARTGEACPEEEADYYLQDALDAIEYAIGDVHTPWGAVRAAAGHPQPYPLAYVEIGNENSGPVYDRRFNKFYKAIKAKYPQLILISNHGTGGIGGAEKTDMIDPHWYVDPEFFFKNADLFDRHERGKYQIYVGEYACNRGVGGGNMLAALSEAAFITGMERNSDLVTMASYAPLFENKNDRAWPTNLIWMTNSQVVGRSSYYVQKMFAEHMPDYNLNISGQVEPEELEPFMEGDGYIGFGTWRTQMDFRNLRILYPDGKEVMADAGDSAQWVRFFGEWNTENGICSQTGNGERTALIWKKARIGKGCTIEFDARKVSGDEGFLFYFGLKDTNLSDGYMLNVGGWGNSSTALEKVHDNNSTVYSEKKPDRLNDGVWQKVRIVINEFGADYYLDGKQVFSHQNAPLKRKFYVAGYDEESNEIIIKVVNATDRKSHARINLKGGKVEKKGRVITLSASSVTDENSFEQPEKIVPQETVFDGFSESFDYEFVPNSLTVLRIRKK